MSINETTNVGLIDALLPKDILEKMADLDRKQAEKGILKNVLEAFTNLLGGDGRVRHIRRLDGHARDGFCEIRAIETLIFEKTIRETPKVAEEIEKACAHIDEFIKGNQELSAQEQRELSAFLSNVHVQILALSNMLCKVKKETTLTKQSKCLRCEAPYFRTFIQTDPEALREVFGNQCSKIVEIAQKLLANLSRDMLQKLLGKDLREDSTGEKVLHLAAANTIDVRFKSKLTDHCRGGLSLNKGDISLQCCVELENNHAKVLSVATALNRGTPLLVIEGYRANCMGHSDSYFDDLISSDLAKAAEGNEKEECVQDVAPLFVAQHIYASSFEEEEPQEGFEMR